MTEAVEVKATPVYLGSSRQLRVLLVPDSIHWITGTIARSITTHNSWLQGTIISGAVLDIVARDNPEIFDSFDIVHFVCPYASRSWLPVLRERLPTVTSHHHVSDDYELQRHNLAGDAIVVGSRQWADDVVERGASRNRVMCIPYGVDASRFVPASRATKVRIRESLGIAPNAIVVGFFAKKSSNERDRKGTDIFASGVQTLSRDLPELAVLIIGPGWDDLVAQLQSVGVKTLWIPFVSDSARMPEMFQALDFYWVTARVEGGPVTLLEAMSTGVCCVTTPVGLAKEVVENGVNGIVVDFDDSQAFARQTLTYSPRTHDREAIGARARSTMLETMDVPVTSKGVRQAYDIAFAHFKMRTARDHEGQAMKAKSVGISPALRERISVLEQLVWAEALMLQAQRPLALRMIAESWARHPLSTWPPRFLLRNILPRGLVRTLVRAKARVAGRA
jgi:glycosyltransferase involved in cell wall biosynthesis